MEMLNGRRCLLRHPHYHYATIINSSLYTSYYLVYSCSTSIDQDAYETSQVSLHIYIHCFAGYLYFCIRESQTQTEVPDVNVSVTLKEMNSFLINTNKHNQKVLLLQKG